MGGLIIYLGKWYNHVLIFKKPQKRSHREVGPGFGCAVGVISMFRMTRGVISLFVRGRVSFPKTPLPNKILMICSSGCFLIFWSRLLSYTYVLFLRISVG